MVNVVKIITKKANSILSPFSKDSRAVSKWSGRSTELPIQVHMKKALDWLCVAQDSTPDGGVSRSYHLAKLPYFNFTGWAPSYAETTGYIIPTFINAASVLDKPELEERAITMADWESSVQMSSGAVCAGLDLDPATSKPAIFNTGQVLFGWIKAYQLSGNQSYLQSAIQAGDFLLASLDDDSNWTQNISPCASGGGRNYRAYNVRSAWALCLLGKLTGEKKYIAAAVRNAELIVSTSKQNGWLPNCCLDEPETPLIHTIAYAARGILEIGLLEEREDLIAAARAMADGVLENLQADGFLAGRLDQDWKPTVQWSCLTGTAQMGIVWGKLASYYGSEKHLDAMKKAISYVSSKQVTMSGDTKLEGGVPGSYPVSGAYGEYQLLNWAAKFFVDLLILEEVIANNNVQLELSDIY